MSTGVFEDYLQRLEMDYEVDEGNDAIDIFTTTADGLEYTITLVAGRTGYSLFVSPLISFGDEPDEENLHRRMLELSETSRHVKLSLDADGDVKIACEGFSRLDAFGQFRRRLKALMGAIDEHGPALADLADGELFA